MHISFCNLAAPAAARTRGALQAASSEESLPLDVACVSTPAAARLKPDSTVAVAAAAAATPHPMGTLVLLRHGESVWNLENRFTGSADPPLSDWGRQQARAAGQRMAAHGLSFDVAFTSALGRAQETADLALAEMGLGAIPRVADAALNERHYGELEGKNRAEMARLHGDEQVARWRHDYYEKPPGGESIAEMAWRTVPCLVEEILPRLQRGENVLVSAHCDSLRALVSHLEQTDAHVVPYVENGVPIVYRFDSGMKILSRQDLENGGDK